MKAIILSGGKGTRLMPLTKNIPKPMLPIDGVPHLLYTVNLLKHSGIVDIIFSTGYLHEEIVNYFGDGSRFGVSITYKEDGDKPLGTAGALKNCEDLLVDYENFIVINGDILTNIDIHEMLFHEFLLCKDNSIMIALAEVSNPEQFGVAITDGHKISGFVEKPKDSSLGNKINAGVYIMDKHVLESIPKDEFCMLETDVFPRYADSGDLYWFQDKSMYWIDIGTHERYNIANDDVRSRTFLPNL